MYDIFEVSMNARIKAIGIVIAIYVLITCIFFETVIENATTLIPVREKIDHYSKELHTSGNLTEIRYDLE